MKTGSVSLMVATVIICLLGFVTKVTAQKYGGTLT